MAISLVSTGYVASTTAATAATPTTPASVLAGDVFVVTINVRTTSATTFTAPTGWTVALSYTGTYTTGALTRVATAANEAMPSFTWSVSGRYVILAEAYRGVDSAIWDVTPTGSAIASSTTVTIPGVTTATANAWFWCNVNVAAATASLTPTSPLVSDNQHTKP